MADGHANSQRRERDTDRQKEALHVIHYFKKVICSSDRINKELHPAKRAFESPQHAAASKLSTMIRALLNIRHSITRQPHQRFTPDCSTQLQTPRSPYRALGGCVRLRRILGGYRRHLGELKHDPPIDQHIIDFVQFEPALLREQPSQEKAWTESLKG